MAQQLPTSPGPSSYPATPVLSPQTSTAPAPPLAAAPSSSAASSSSLQSGNPGATASRVLDSWRAFDLSAKRNSLDAQAQEMTENQDAGANTRRKLAEDTRNFRKSQDDEKLKSFGALLKSYQDEIDRLTRRAKFAEGGFLSIYRSLADIPDPVATLDNLLNEAQKSTRVMELEVENRRLQKELGEFRQEFREIKNQEVTIRRQEDKLREYETKLESLVADRVADTEKTQREELLRITQQFEEKEHSWQHRVQQLQADLSHAQKLNDSTQSQLIDFKAKHDEELHNRQLELELLNAELERANTRLMSLEKELNTQEQSGNSGSKPNPAGGSAETLPDLELALAQKDIELSRLNETKEKLENELKKNNAEHMHVVRALNEQLLQTKDKVAHLQTQLEKMPTEAQLNLMKKRLQIFEAIEPGSASLDEEPLAKSAATTTSKSAPNSNSNSNSNSSSSEDDPASMDRLTRGKLRQLEAECTRLRVALAESREAHTTAVEQLTLAQNSSQKYQLLIQQLEDDLSKARSNLPAAHLNMSNNSNSGSNNNSSQQQQLSASASSAAQQTNNSGLEIDPTQQQKPRDDASLLQIVSSQRDRFRTRIQELESELSKSQISFDRLRMEIGALKTDNVKLYEKIKYLQSYSADVSAGGSKGNGVQLRANATSVDMEAIGDLENKYKALYEESINPFTIFNKRERDIRYAQLNPADKFTLFGSRLLLANKHTRLFLFFYSVSLHLLVMFALYKLAYADVSSVCSYVTAQLTVAAAENITKVIP